MGNDVKIRKEGELELHSFEDVYRAIDDRALDFSNVRDLYRVSIIQLRASALY